MIYLAVYLIATAGFYAWHIYDGLDYWDDYYARYPPVTKPPEVI